MDHIAFGQKGTNALAGWSFSAKPFKTTIYRGLSIAKFDYQRVPQDLMTCMC
jgi:hypothetical protein